MVIAVLLPDQPLMAAYMSLFIIQAAIAAHLMCDPFYSGRQQSLEMLSLTVTLVAYHLGILLRAGGDGSQSDGVQLFFSALQFALNAGVIWRFFSCIFKDMLLVRLMNNKLVSLLRRFLQVKFSLHLIIVSFNVFMSS